MPADLPQLVFSDFPLFVKLGGKRLSALANVGLTVRFIVGLFDVFGLLPIEPGQFPETVDIDIRVTCLAEPIR
jgi:hypothetical protein